MEITEVRIKLMEDNSGSNERLQAFCSITFDDMFVIRDLKIIEGAKGFFVAMPSRKLTDRCHNCGTKNHLRSRFCNQCGCRLDENRAIRDADGRAKLHADIAHPINSMCREKIQSAVLASYADELERSKLPGYVSRYDDLDGDCEMPLRVDRARLVEQRGRAAAPARTAPRPYPAHPGQSVGAPRPTRPAPQGEPRRGDRLRPRRFVRQRTLRRAGSARLASSERGLAPGPRGAGACPLSQRFGLPPAALPRGPAFHPVEEAFKGVSPWRQDAVSWRPRCSSGRPTHPIPDRCPAPGRSRWVRSIGRWLVIPVVLYLGIARRALRAPGPADLSRVRHPG